MPMLRRLSLGFVATLVGLVFLNCAQSAPLAPPTDTVAPPTPTITQPLTVEQRGHALQTFRAALGHPQHQVQWFQGETDALMWVVPPGSQHYKPGKCSPALAIAELGDLDRCITGRVQNTTDIPMVDAFVVCGYPDGSNEPLMGVGTILPGEAGTWEWRYIPRLGDARYLCRMVWLVR